MLEERERERVCVLGVCVARDTEGVYWERARQREIVCIKRVCLEREPPPTRLVLSIDFPLTMR